MIFGELLNPEGFVKILPLSEREPFRAPLISTRKMNQSKVLYPSVGVFPVVIVYTDAVNHEERVFPFSANRALSNELGKIPGNVLKAGSGREQEFVVLVPNDHGSSGKIGGRASGAQISFPQIGAQHSPGSRVESEQLGVEGGAFSVVVVTAGSSESEPDELWSTGGFPQLARIGIIKKQQKKKRTFFINPPKTKQGP